MGDRATKGSTVGLVTITLINNFVIEEGGEGRTAEHTLFIRTRHCCGMSDAVPSGCSRWLLLPPSCGPA